MVAKQLSLSDVQINLVVEDEQIGPLDSYCVPGIISRDDPDAQRFADDVQEMIDDYGLWGWCQVTVEARLGPLVGRAYLGGCSYANEEDFKNGGYYDDLVDEAIEDLQSQIDELLPLIVA